MRRCTFKRVSFSCALWATIACSGVTSTSRSAKDDQTAATSSDANSSESSSRSPVEITGTNLVLGSDNFQSASITGSGAARKLIPKITGDKLPVAIRAYTTVTIRIDGDSRVFVLANTEAADEQRWGPTVQLPLPSDFPTGGKARVAVRDRNSGVEVSREVDNGGISGGSAGGIHRVFMTSQEFPGNFALGFAGIEGDPTPAAFQAADSKCWLEAIQNGLSGTFKAVISVPNFSARDRFQFTGPVQQVGDARIFAMGTHEFFDSDREFPFTLVRSASGQEITQNLGFWSGSEVDFRFVQSSSGHCGEWKIAVGEGRQTNFTSHWSGPGNEVYHWHSAFQPNCTDLRRLLCLEQ